MKRIFFVFLALILFCLFSPSAYASSSYVLPYPGIMPGNKLYKVSTILEKLKSYYSFGDFAQFDYNLSESDKYLVEAKTLFEYGQYLLAVNALDRSDQYFQKVYPDLVQAKKNGKSTLKKSEVYAQAKEKHIEELNKMKKSLPLEFVWTEESSGPTTILIHKRINNSIRIRLQQ